MGRTLRSIAVVTTLCILVSTPVWARTPQPTDTLLTRTQAEQIPIGAIVKLRTRGGERLRAVLLSADETGVRVKPATRIPEPSRRIDYDQIDRIERHQDRVSVGKYTGVGSAIGAAAMLLLIAGL